jgi:hypothetical protein
MIDKTDKIFMTQFIAYKPTDSFRYHMSPYCFLCGRKTDSMMVYHYRGVELAETVFPIPVHPFCFRKKKVGLWLGTAVLFLATVFGGTLLGVYVVYSERNLMAAPVWLLFLNSFFGLLAAGYYGIRYASNFEHRIAVYKRHHTDYEDYYKADRRRRAGRRNWY